MAKLSSVKRDVEKASQGIWRTFEGIDFCIARIDNPDAKKELRRLSKLERATRRDQRGVVGGLRDGWRQRGEGGGLEQRAAAQRHGMAP